MFSELLAQWSSIVTCIDPIAREDAAESLAQVYAQIGEPKPSLVYCQSPFQMALLLRLLQVTDSLDASEFKSDLRSNLSSLRPAEIDEQLWAQLSERFESQLVAQFGSQIDWSLLQELKQQLLPDSKSPFEERFLTHWSDLYKRAVYIFMDPLPREKLAPEEQLSGVDAVMAQIARAMSEIRASEMQDWQERIRRSVVRFAQTFPAQIRFQIGRQLPAERSTRMHEIWKWHVPSYQRRRKTLSFRARM